MPDLSSAAECWLESVITPEFPAPATLEEWHSRSLEIRQTLHTLLGDFPPRPALPEVTMSAREARGDCIVERFQFENGLGMTVFGYLLLPRGASAAHPAPAILYHHWHGGQYHIGKEELFLTNAAPVPPGPALVQQGYAVMAIDACCFGEREGAGPGGETEMGASGEMTAAKFQLWAGRSLWGVVVRDDLMALDYLCSRPEIDAGRVGVCGISMGSTRSWWMMAMDERPRVSVNMACMTRYRDLACAGNLKAHGIYYYVPSMLRYFDSEAVMALGAPRPALFLTGDLDTGSPVEGMTTLGEKVKPIYALHGVPGNFESTVFPGVGHVCLPEMWKLAVDWLGKNLSNS